MGQHRRPPLLQSSIRQLGAAVRRADTACRCSEVGDGLYEWPLQLANLLLLELSAIDKGTATACPLGHTWIPVRNPSAKLAFDLVGALEKHLDIEAQRGECIVSPMQAAKSTKNEAQVDVQRKGNKARHNHARLLPALLAMRVSAS